MWTGLGLLSGFIIMDLMKIKKQNFWIGTFMGGLLGFVRGYAADNL